MEKIAQIKVPEITGPDGPFSNAATDSTGIFAGYLSSIIGLLTVIAGIYFLFLLLTGAIAVMQSEGDKTKVETASAKIRNGLVGLVVVVAGIFLIDLIGGFLGLDIINIESTLNNLTL